MGGCVGTPIMPKSSMPVLPRENIYAHLSPATGWLDCLSAELCDTKPPMKIMIGDIPNTMGQTVGDLQLPSDMKSFVLNSFGRISCGYELAESNSLVGLPGLSQHLPQLSGAYPGLVEDLILADQVKPVVIISGTLFLAQTTSSAGGDLEIISLGIGSKVTAYDVSLQLRAFGAKTRSFIIPPTTLHVRFYTGEHGASAFYLDSNGNLTRGKAAVVKAPSVLDALQYLSDFATAALVRDLSSALFSRSFATCDQETGDIDTSRIQSRAHAGAGKKLPLRLKLFKQNGTVCAKAESLPGYHLNSSKKVNIYWNQYATKTTLNIPIGPTLVGRAPATILNGSKVFCIPHNKQQPQTQNWEVKIETENHEIIGVGTL